MLHFQCLSLSSVNQMGASVMGRVYFWTLDVALISDFRRQGWLRWGPAEEGTALARGSFQPTVISGEVAVRSCTCSSWGDVLKVCVASNSKKVWAPETTPDLWNCSGQNCSSSPSASILSCPVTLPFLYSVSFRCFDFSLFKKVIFYKHLSILNFKAFWSSTIRRIVQVGLTECLR